jgi:hypothetical protein
MIDFQLEIPAVFLRLRPAQLADFSNGMSDDDDRENESFYYSALKSSIDANQTVTDQLLWDLAIELDKKKANASLTALGYIHVALFVPEFYYFISAKTAIDIEKYQAGEVIHISDGILKALIEILEDRILPNFHGARASINLLDHYLSEYLFEINLQHYQQQLLLSPEKKIDTIQLLLSLSVYGSRNAFRYLHEIYGHDISTSEHMQQLEVTLKELKAYYAAYQFEQIFDVGATYHLVAMYSHILSRFGHLIIAEMHILATIPYRDSSLPDCYTSLVAIEQEAIELADTLEKLLTQQEKSIYQKKQIDLMRQDYQEKFKPTILEPGSRPTQIFQKHLDHYETQRLKAQALQCSM